MDSKTSFPTARNAIGVLAALLTLTLAMFAGSPANATTTEASDDSGMFQGPDGLERGMAEAKGGLGIHFDLQPGDEIEISDNKQLATIIAADGTELVRFDSPKVKGSEHAIFQYEDNVLTAEAANADGTPVVSAQGCPKASAISWGWTILWDGMVCLPFGIGTAGVGGFMCGVAGSGVSSFVPWDKVCG